MKSSKPLYAILGVYIPLSVLILWAPVPGLVYRFFSPVSVFDERLMFLAGFLSALAASCYAGLVKNSLLFHKAAVARGSIVAAVAAYILVSLLRRNPLSVSFIRRFFPSAAAIAGVLAAVFAWFSTISVSDVFKGYEFFESFTVKHRGEELRETIREFSPELSQTNQNLKSLISSYGIQFIPPCLLFIGSNFFRAFPAFTLFTLFIFVTGFILLGFLGFLRRELLCATEGISLTMRDRSLPIPVMAIGTGIAALLALISSSDASLLPPGIILVFFSWLGRLISSLFKPGEPAEFDFPRQMGMSMERNSLADMFPDTENSGPWAGWKWIKYGILALAVFLFLLFMIYPLLKRSGFSLKPTKIRAAIGRWLRDLKKGFRAFFVALRDRGSTLKMKKPDPEKLRRIASELSFGRRKEARRSANLFARIILWGIETIGVAWKPSIPPGEYCALLAAVLEKTAAPEPPVGTGQVSLGEAVTRCGELFEKALYALMPLSTAEEKEFRREVEKITG